MQVLVQYSGGKDSQASLIWAVKLYGAANIKAVFCDTKWEHKLTYHHIKQTCNDLGVELITLTSKKYDGMVGLAKKKGRFPSTRARFCTQELKTIPFIDYVLDECQHILTVQGIRGDESASRSKMKIQCSVFKYYFEPYQTNTIIVEQLSALSKLSHAQKTKLTKAKNRLALGKEDAKYHTYRKKEVIAFVNSYADDIIRPHFEKTGQYVIDYIIANGQNPNPLYKMGSMRVGCYPCIMSGHNEVLQMILRDPERISEIQQIEIDLDSSFFPPDYIPEYARTKVDKNGKKYPSVTDVKKYLLAKNGTMDMFEPDRSISCSSYYHLCE